MKKEVTLLNQTRYVFDLVKMHVEVVGHHSVNFINKTALFKHIKQNRAVERGGEFHAVLCHSFQVIQSANYC